MQTLVVHTLYRASSTVFFGAHLPDDTFFACAAFDAEMFYLSADVPLLNRRGARVRDRFAATVADFLREHWMESEGGGFLDGGASDTTSAAIRSMKSAGLTEDEVSRILVLILWGVHSNMLLVALWTMIYLVADPSAYTRVCDAIRAAYPGVSPSTFTLIDNFTDGYKTLVPFGGGLFMCKGREFALRIIETFFIMFMQMYDVADCGYAVPAKRNGSVSMVKPKTIPSIKVRRR
ncbi:cytochrome P450 [Vararia minispora EC-137]|uniref:Cytochrome P450 n=1 Tax=Vararia minispora EC-137 TaxID=1314806 RepID=A0ACB8QXR7_9AGAM|nr:cytochrome P450 [Vararia minispora EC-137]